MGYRDIQNVQLWSTVAIIYDASKFYRVIIWIFNKRSLWEVRLLCDLTCGTKSIILRDINNKKHVIVTVH